MEALYTSVRSWGTEEYKNIYFPSWKGVDEYQDPVDPISLSSNFADVFPEVARLLNSHVERTVILNDITQYNNKVLVDKVKETVKFNRLERSMEEAMSEFQIVVEVEQRNGGPHQKRHLAENENPAMSSNQEQGMDKSIKKRKVIEIQPIAVGVEVGGGACRGNPA